MLSNKALDVVSVAREARKPEHRTDECFERIPGDSL
jgi:hypothetical protein